MVFITYSLFKEDVDGPLKIFFKIDRTYFIFSSYSFEGIDELFLSHFYMTTKNEPIKLLFGQFSMFLKDYKICVRLSMLPSLSNG